MLMHLIMSFFGALSAHAEVTLAGIQAMPMPTPTALAVAQAAQSAAGLPAPLEADTTGFLAQVFAVVTSLGGLSWGLKISSILTLVIASMKVSKANDLIWSKLGSLQVFVGPLLGLLIGVFALPTLTGPSIAAYLMAGAGSILIHQILDGLKQMPWVGTKYQMLIWFVSKYLGGPAAAPVEKVASVTAPGAK